MLTRLKVSGFKNLVDVDIRFGAFTCIAGANGVGKSNLFDAIRFLSLLADRPFLEAALSVRDEGGHSADIRSIFHRVGDEYVSRMSFEVEMVVPGSGIDDLGQSVQSSITFLRYQIVLVYRENGSKMAGTIELEREELSHIKLGDARRNLLFPHGQEWRKSAVRGKRRVPHFISTAGDGPARLVKVHQDGGSSGRPRPLRASQLPRSALSAATSSESPTATVARREMQSWRLIQLEPSSLRRPDSFTAPSRLGMDGSHLAATLYHLAHGLPEAPQAGEEDAASAGLYAQVANRLSELVEDVRDLWVDRDEKRELLTLQVRGSDGTPHPGRALSDGTLRFLALAVLEHDTELEGLLCLEEPENGIHPERIPAMLRLLQDISVDVNEVTGTDNPLRQVIINTHSPAVVGQVCDQDLLVAEGREVLLGGRRCKALSFGCLPDTWRSKAGTRIVSRGRLLAYLNPGMPAPERDTAGSGRTNKPSRRQRVADRPDLQLDLDYNEATVA